MSQIHLMNFLNRKMTDDNFKETFPFYKNKNILVCGGDGFIGSHLTDLLLKSDAEITVSSRKFKQKNENKQKVKHIQADFNDLRKCKEVVKDFDFVFNTTGKSGGIDYAMDNNKELFFKNSILNLNLLLAISESNVKRYQYLSSAAVYPRNAHSPLTESTDLHFNESFGYPDAKILGENQCKIFSDEIGLNISVIRADNTFGPRDNFSETARVIPSLIQKTLTSEKVLEVWGSGNQIRSFIFVKDLVRGMLLGLEKYPEPDPINISSNEIVSIKKLVEIILRLSKKDLDVRFNTKKPEGSLERSLDISKAKKILGFESKWNLEKSLQNTIDWFKEQKF